MPQRAPKPGVSPTALRAAIETRRFAERVERDVESGAANGVHGTPTVFINGERYRGPRDVASLRQAIASAPAN